MVNLGPGVAILQGTLGSQVNNGSSYTVTVGSGGTITGDPYLGWYFAGGAVGGGGGSGGNSNSVISFGADPTGVRDSSGAFNSAAAAVKGVNPTVYVPAGTYLINSLVALTNQCLFGDGQANTTILITSALNPASVAAPFTIGGTAGLISLPPCIHDLTISETEPQTPTATLTGASIAAGTLTATIVTGTPANGNILYDAAQGSPTGVPNGALLSAVSIVGSALTATVTPAVTVASENMSTAQGRTNFAALGTCNGTTIGCKYPPAIVATGTQFAVWNVTFSSTWDSIANSSGNSLGGCLIQNVHDGALDVGLNLVSIFNWCDILNYEHHSRYGEFTGPLRQMYTDGNTVSAILGAAGTFGGVSGEADGVQLTNYKTFSARTQAGGGSSFGVFSGASFDSAATLEISNGQHWDLTNVYWSGAAVGVNTNCALNVTGGIVRVWGPEFSVKSNPQNGHVSLPAVCESNATTNARVEITGGKGFDNANSIPEMTLTGSGTNPNNTVLQVIGHTFDAGASGSTAWTDHLVDVTGTGSTLLFSNNTFSKAPTGGNVGAVSIASDAAANIVNGNNWNGWGWTPPGNAGLYGLNGVSQTFAIDPASAGCNGNIAGTSKNIAPTVDAVVTAGFKAAVIPSNCLYIPDGNDPGGTVNVTPHDFSTIGQDLTSVVSTPSSSTILSMGARSQLENISVGGQFCQTQVPGWSGTTCPLPGIAINSQNVAQNAQIYPGDTADFFLGNVTYGGNTSTAGNGPRGPVALTFGAGDAFFAGCTGAGSDCIRTSSTTTDQQSVISEQDSSDNYPVTYQSNKARGTSSARLVVQTNDLLYGLNVYGYDGTNFIKSGALLFQGVGTIASSQVPGAFTLQLANSAGSLLNALSVDEVAGKITTNTNQIATTAGDLMGTTFSTRTHCASGASPAVCAAAAAGSVAIPAGAAQTLVVQTTAVTATSQILLTADPSATVTATTCNTTFTTQGPLVVTARTAGTSFTIENTATSTTNPVCVDYLLVN